MYLQDFIKLQRQLQETQDQLKAQKLECQCLRMDLGAASNVNAALRHTNFNLEQDLRDERRLRVQLRLRIEKLRATSPRAKTDISTDPGLERAAMKVTTRRLLCIAHLARCVSRAANEPQDAEHCSARRCCLV